MKEIEVKDATKELNEQETEKVVGGRVRRIVGPKRGKPSRLVKYDDNKDNDDNGGGGATGGW